MTHVPNRPWPPAAEPSAGDRAAAQRVGDLAHSETALELPPAPAQAGEVFGDRLDLAREFVRLLADTGISRGLIGPRETPRLWDRHVLNCAVVHQAIPKTGSTQQVVDVGSGAGLPGLALAIARPDLFVHLVEPLARRTAWLGETAAELGLANVRVHTARAEALWDELAAPWVTARAVSGIVQLAQWCLPLLSAGGSLLALKGARAGLELDENRVALQRLGVVDASVDVYGDDLAEPTTVLRLTIAAPVDRRSFSRRGASSAGSARRRADRPRGTRGSQRGAADDDRRRQPGSDSTESST